MRILRAAGLAAYRYETIWLVTSEDVAIVPAWKVAVIFPRRFSAEDVRQRAEMAISGRGAAWTVETEGTDGVLVVGGTDEIDATLRSIADIRAPDWEVTAPQRFTGQSISLRMENAPLKDVLAFYSNLTGRPHVPGDGTNVTGLNRKEEKLIRHIGFSAHTTRAALAALSTRRPRRSISSA